MVVIRSNIDNNSTIDTISIWDKKIKTAESFLDYPSILRLKTHYKIPRLVAKFNRVSVFRRDMYLCQYCGEQVTARSATLDHVIPTSRGGKNCWTNCVTACHPCNSKKRNRTPEEANMQLMETPFAPKRPLHNDYRLENPKHPDWEMYF